MPTTYSLHPTAYNSYYNVDVLYKRRVKVSNQIELYRKITLNDTQGFLHLTLLK